MPPTKHPPGPPLRSPPDRPASFARVLHETRVLRKRRIFRECHRRQIQQPRTNDAPAPPYFGDIRKVQIVAQVLGQFFAGRILENVESLSIGLHDPVLDSVMHHLDKMAGARRPAMDVAFFRCSAAIFSRPGVRGIRRSRSQRFENRIRGVAPPLSGRQSSCSSRDRCPHTPPLVPTST